MGVSEKANRLNRSQWSPDDEYYTKYEHVEFIFNNYLKNVDFKDKIIYCFCDGKIRYKRQLIKIKSPYLAHIEPEN